MADFYPSDYEAPREHSEDGLPYGRSRKKEYVRMLAYLEAIKKKGPSKLVHYSTMLSSDAPTPEDPYAGIRKLIKDNDQKLARKNLIKRKHKRKSIKQNSMVKKSVPEISTANKYQIYIIEIDDPLSVYVGQSSYTPEVRLKKHLSGVDVIKQVSKANHPKLRPDLYEHIPIYASREDAEHEVNLKIRLLRIKGYNVNASR